jgi:integrase
MPRTATTTSWHEMSKGSQMLQKRNRRSGVEDRWRRADAHRPSAVERLVATGSEFPRVTPHDLQHTAASLAISGGANPKAVQTMLGHQSAALTLDTYADLFPDDLELVSAALDRARQAASKLLRTNCGLGLNRASDRHGRYRV